MSELLSDVDDRRLHLVENDKWQEGMGSSLACGMSAILAMDKQPYGVLVSLCDQPYLTAEIIREINAAFASAPNKIIASAYSGTIGPPVLFPKEFFANLKLCSGDKGARKILMQQHGSVLPIDFPQLALDIDTPEEYERLINP